MGLTTAPAATPQDAMMLAISAAPAAIFQNASRLQVEQAEGVPDSTSVSTGSSQGHRGWIEAPVSRAPGQQLNLATESVVKQRDSGQYLQPDRSARHLHAPCGGVFHSATLVRATGEAPCCLLGLWHLNATPVPGYANRAWLVHGTSRLPCRVTRLSMAVRLPTSSYFGPRPHSDMTPAQLAALLFGAMAPRGRSEPAMKVSVAGATAGPMSVSNRRLAGM